MEAGDQDLVAHLVATRLSGRVATSSSGSRHNCARLVEGQPDCTFGLSDWRDATYDEVVAAVHAAGGRELEADAAVHPDGGFIEPDATLDGIHRHRRALAEFVACGGGRVLLATGHPWPLGAHYGTVAGALAAAGCEILSPMGSSVDYVDGVAALAFDGGRQHTHRPDWMLALLEQTGGRSGVDLVVGDHGFAGAAIEAGIPTLSIADVNDPALPLAQARGRTSGVLLIDDGLDPKLFVPVTEAVLKW